MGIQPNLRAVSGGRAGQHLREAAVTPLVEGPGAADTVMLAHRQIEPVQPAAR